MRTELLGIGAAGMVWLAAIGLSAAQQCDGIWVSVAANERRCLGPGAAGEVQGLHRLPRMVVVPAGRFTMGSPPNERGASEDQVAVTIASPFANRCLCDYPPRVRGLRYGN
jgi:formylglycine-generating enzyme required for sulfatase activity